MRQNVLHPLHPLRLLLMLRLVVRLAAVWMKKLWLPSGLNPWRRMKKTRGRLPFGGAGAGLGGHPVDAHFQDMTEMARQPKDNKLKRELDFILDIPLDVSAELGRTRLLINELLQLGQGSVVELNKLAGEPLEVFVNGKLVARGEAVVINEKFGVRLTDIISPIERVKQLG
jgi:flagellar motor switch protein FliN